MRGFEDTLQDEMSEIGYHEGWFIHLNCMIIL